MKAYRRFESLRQMSYGLGAFVVVALLLESAGLEHWAERLDLGPERTVALPIANALHRVLQPLRLERLRSDALVGLARIRWSDDPEELEEASGTATTPATPLPATVVAPATPVSPGHPGASAVAPKTPPSTPLPLIEGAPSLLTPLPAIAPVEAGRTRTVALAGDSMMAVGLSSTMM